MSEEQKRQLAVGAAMVYITPELGTPLNGDGTGAHPAAREVLEPLYAKSSPDVRNGGSSVQTTPFHWTNEDINIGMCAKRRSGALRIDAK